MRSIRALFVACVVGLLALAVATTASAQALDQRTLFTFDQPVVLPGITLPAGTYLFRVTGTDRRVIQILSEDGRRIHTTLLAIPALRSEPAEKPEVRFLETPADMPMAIKTWWYPGRATGYEFIYPKEQAQRLARTAAEPVLTTVTAEVPAEEMATTDLARVGRSGEETRVLDEDSPEAADPTGLAHQGTLASESIQLPAPVTDMTER